MINWDEAGSCLLVRRGRQGGCCTPRTPGQRGHWLSRDGARPSLGISAKLRAPGGPSDAPSSDSLRSLTSEHLMEWSQFSCRAQGGPSRADPSSSMPILHLPDTHNTALTRTFCFFPHSLSSSCICFIYDKDSRGSSCSKGFFFAASQRPGG